MQDYTLTGLYTLPIVSLSLTGWSLNLEKNEPVLDRFMDERALPWPFQLYLEVSEPVLDWLVEDSTWRWMSPSLTGWNLNWRWMRPSLTCLQINPEMSDRLKTQLEMNEPFFDFFTNQPGDEWASPWLVENSTRRKMNLSLTALHWFKTLPGDKWTCPWLVQNSTWRWESLSSVNSESCHFLEKIFL